MTAALIGILSGIIIIVITALYKRINHSLFYGLILCSIGFLYVGFTWRDTTALIVNVQQAIFFLLVAYYGVRTNLLILAIGFFLHGCWDIIYGLLSNSQLVPPHYDVFCLSVDYIISGYLLYLHYKVQSPAKKTLRTLKAKL